MRTHWRHTSTTTNKYHLGIGIFGEKVTKRTVYGNLVTWFQAKHIGRHDTWRHIITARRWCGDTDVELDHALFFRIVGHRVSTDGGFFHIGHIAPDVEFVPVLVEFLLDITLPVLNAVRRPVQLDIAASTEVDALALRHNHRRLFDESGHVRA